MFLLLEHSARVLPASSVYRLSRPIGHMLRPKTRRGHAIRMMKTLLDLPGWQDEDWGNLFRRHADTVGRITLEQIRWLRLAPAEIRRQIRVEGHENVEPALSGPKGLVLLTAHTANFSSVLVTAPTLGRETWGLGGQLPSWLADRSYGRFCRSIGLDRRRPEPGISGQLDALLNRGGVAVTFGDLTTVRHHNAWVPFCRAEILVSLGPMLLASRNGVPTVPVISSDGPDGGPVVTFHPPLTLPQSGDRLRDAFLMSCEFMRLVTRETEREPEKWWNWDYGRFRDHEGGTWGNVSRHEIHEFSDRESIGVRSNN